MIDGPDRREPRRDTLSALLRKTSAVLLDFDGPVTDLFHGHSTAPVARKIKTVVADIWGPLDPDVQDCEDSHGILQLLRDMYDRPAPAPRDRAALDKAEDIVTQFEYEMAASAVPTEGCADLLDALAGLPQPPHIAIVSNNAAGPISLFLEKHHLSRVVELVVGRDPHELRHMKPDPDSVKRAARQLGALPGSCVLIGDQLTDLEAAQRAGARFLGYTRSTERAAAMKRYGAGWVTDSHKPLIEAATALRRREQRPCGAG
ncbi:HAD family hydrolase [Streptomyces sp. B93]|uniref:HAD family hydrolase n=1 Tax=Streptomyces sp. B93 TaxID=2824875 RepID=UPI001B387BA1|nr:HAD family phosphatase [Streptomyces sp. B93]MBQ1089207.1 HAD family phosphatase [Streptomyces sp. B93]